MSVEEEDFDFDVKTKELKGVRNGTKGDLVKLSVIETPSKYFVKVTGDGGPFPRASIFNYFINGASPESTHLKTWAAIDCFPTSVETTKSRGDINHRWVLRDPAYQSEKFPFSFRRDEGQYRCEGCWEWREDYRTISSLYQLECDKQEDEIVEHPFEIVEHLKVEEEIDFHGIKIPAFSDEGFRKEKYNVTEENVRYNIFDQLVVPSIMMPLRPCKLSSKDSYNIVRQFLKENVDARYAEITSDYNFCFTVKKKIILDYPVKQSIDVTPPRGRKKRYETRWRKSREVQVFEMTWSPECYKGYTPIAPFEGKNIKDLEENINKFCEDLLSEINSPMEDCPHCHGMGVIIKDPAKEGEE